jgi:hypothetical protein
MNISAKNIMKMTAGSFQKLSSASALKPPTLPVNQRALGSVKPGSTY